MIAQLLNRGFVLEQLRAVEEDLAAASGEGRRGITGPAGSLSEHDVALALDQVRRTAEREAAESSGQKGGYEAPPADRRRGPAPAPLDDFSFFSRDPVMSLLQSVLEEYFETRHPADIEEAPPVDDRRGLVGDVAITDISLRGWEPSRDPEGRRVFGRFEPTDLRWVSSLVAMGLRRFRGKHDFNPLPAAPLSLADRVRLVLVGDWGTALPRASKVAAHIGRVLDEGRSAGLEQHVVHLGDVYYSGFKREYERRFLSSWPVAPTEATKIGSWCLNGNHDMYSGGHDYFGYLLADDRFTRQERSSFFSLSTPHWDILALDTAWEDGGLCDPQAEWVHTKIESSERKVLLLSHHQLFSVYEGDKPAIEAKLRGVLDSGRIRAWFWGHEHRCMLYAPHAGVAQARCIGHGGVPVYMWHEQTDPYPPPGIYEYREYLDAGLERWALFGFAVLDFDGPVIRVRYIDENGIEHKREDLE